MSNDLFTTEGATNLIGFQWVASEGDFFQAFSTVSQETLPGKFYYATQTQVEDALTLAQSAFFTLQQKTYEERAVFLDAIADEIMALGDSLIERCTAETALPAARIIGERARTCGQLKLFAQLLRDGWFADARIDTAIPDRTPLPKPDIRRMLVGLGPVLVYGASNFPLAFSTAGGDTASALAAGCPVIVKAHSAHPGTNQLVSSAIAKAAQKTGMPEGVFSSVYLKQSQSLELVKHPTIKAVGFTGSRKAGMIFFLAAANRPEPIPVYAEMSSINPVLMLPNAIASNKEKLAEGLVASLTMGVGQFCTNPGLVLAIDGEDTQAFLKLLAQAVEKTQAGAMLTQGICKAYNDGVKNLSSLEHTTVLAQSLAQAADGSALPAISTVPAQYFISDKRYSEEVFGPSTLVVLCQNEAELLGVIQCLEGQLTATIHATEADEQLVREALPILIHKAGRILYGGYPTGVEVCHSMQHGGPFPSTTDARSTSVGTAAIQRFLRPVAYQSFPDGLLPDVLQASNPLAAPRLEDGKWKLPS